MSDEEHSPDNVSAAMLNRRQREVAALLVAGYTNKEIANELGLTPATVETYLQQLRSRLGLKRRIQIAVWAMRQGLGPRSDEPDRS